MIWAFASAQGCAIDDFMATATAPSRWIMRHDGRGRKVSPNLIYLRTVSAAIEEIRIALGDAIRCSSDHTIAMVAQMAAYEATLGDVEVCRTHMQGIMAMVHLRGGLGFLG